MGVLKELENTAVDERDRPKKACVIANCGELEDAEEVSHVDHGESWRATEVSNWEQTGFLKGDLIDEGKRFTLRMETKS